MMWSLFRRSDPIQKLWKWFEANQGRLRDEPRDDNAFLELGDHLKLIDKSLTYEIDGEDLQISADGVPELIETVRTVVSSAPSIPGWNVVAFRQPRADQPSISVFDIDLSVENVLFTVEQVKEGAADIVLYLPGITDENSRHLAHCAMLLMESLIGEYAVMTKIGEIEYEEATDIPSVAKPLSELPSVLPA